MKKTIAAMIMLIFCTALFAQNAESDFIIDTDGTITGYVGWDENVIIPASIGETVVRAIGTSAFEANDLTSVSIPGSVSSIRSFAFNKNRLTSVTIPESVSIIGDSAFSRNQLASVSISGDNVRIYSEAFTENPLNEITLGRGHIFEADIVSSTDENPNSLYFDYACNDRQAGTYLVNRTISVKQEGDYQYVETPYGVYITGYSGSGENRLVIPDRLGTFPVKAVNGFANKRISRVQIPDGVNYIGIKAFTGNQMTVTIIPGSVTYIGDDAFSDNLLTGISIPDSVSYIGSAAFRNNKLAGINIPNSVAYIGFGAFMDNQLASITISESATNIGANAFMNNQLTSLSIPESITYIGRGTFSDNRLGSVVIPNSVTHIDYGAFSGNQLTSIIIGAGVNLLFANFTNTGNVGPFNNSFEIVYNSNGKTAGIYTRSGTDSSTWTIQ
jgi:hypothetical protein